MPKDEKAESDLIRPIPIERIQDRVLDFLADSDETGVADAVDLLISQGAYLGASDLHMEPWLDCYSVRYRLDGILQQIAIIPREYQQKITARIKVIADLVVYRRDIPQDGRVDQEKTSCGRPMRISTVPTLKGEKTVIRLLGETQEQFALDTLGFDEKTVTMLRRVVMRPQGTFLLTGPSSSGKTTTIYALLREMMSLQKNTTNIVTIEDPVECSIDRVAQIQINPHVDFTFATALRAILRQDPEVIMVGEIRDVETARMAIQSGLTGHLVISTIHSGTAAGVFTRLLDMGIEPFLVASSISGVLAQRLVRLNCPDCAKVYKPDPILVKHFAKGKRNQKFFHGTGCNACQHIGYRGRASIGELLTVNPSFADHVLERETTQTLHQVAIEEGMVPLDVDGYNKVSKGITTLEELMRVMPAPGE